MRDRGSPTVVKLGGSLAFTPYLRPWLAAVAEAGGATVLVPGGGPFADAVREAQPEMRFDDKAAHAMALLAMEQYGRALVSLQGNLHLADSAAAIGRALETGRVPVWAPARMVQDADDVPASWEVTSDSLAAWLARQIGARRILFVKHGALAGDGSKLADLVAAGVVDPALPGFLAGAGLEARIAAPRDHAAAAAWLRRHADQDADVGSRIVCA